MRFDKNIDVVVVDGEGNKFAEWGRQKMRGNRFSCYIQSETGTSFGIRLVAAPDIMREMDDRQAAMARYSAEPGFHEPPAPTFEFLATLRLDGRETHEKCNIVYLDRQGPWFRHGGMVEMTGKTIRESKDSDVKFHRWVFQKIGIEDTVEDLTLVPDGQAPETEDALVQAMQNLGSNNLADKEETAKAGVIEITIHRARVMNKIFKCEVLPDQSTRGPATGSSKAGRDISHTTSRDDGTKAPSNVSTRVNFDMVDGAENPWAVFTFFYRSEEVLRKFDFPGFPEKETKPGSVAMAKLATDAGPTKRGTDELDGDLDTDGDAVSAKKVRQNTGTIEGNPLTSAGSMSKASDSEDDDFDEQKLQDELEEEWRELMKTSDDDFGKPYLAGPNRAAFSAHSTFSPSDTMETTKPDTGADVVEQESAETGEEI